MTTDFLSSIKKQTNVKPKEFWDFFDRNLIYCEQTHSFTHRLTDAIIKRKDENNYSHCDSQADAWRIIDEMFEDWTKWEEELKR